MISNSVFLLVQAAFLPSWVSREHRCGGSPQSWSLSNLFLFLYRCLLCDSVPAWPLFHDATITDTRDNELTRCPLSWWLPFVGWTASCLGRSVCPCGSTQSWCSHARPATATARTSVTSVHAMTKQEQRTGLIPVTWGYMYLHIFSSNFYLYWPPPTPTPSLLSTAALSLSLCLQLLDLFVSLCLLPLSVSQSAAPLCLSLCILIQLTMNIRAQILLPWASSTCKHPIKFAG